MFMKPVISCFNFRCLPWNLKSVNGTNFKGACIGNKSFKRRVLLLQSGSIMFCKNKILRDQKLLDLLKKFNKQGAPNCWIPFHVSWGRCAVYSCHIWSGYWFVNFSKFYLRGMFYIKSGYIWPEIKLIYGSFSVWMDKNHCDKKIHNSCSSGVELASNFVYSHPYECSGIYIPRIVAAKVMNLHSASSKSATVHTSVCFIFRLM